MTCEHCDAKMKCTYSIPVKRTRFRVYKCLNGCTMKETIELDVYGIADVATIKQRITEGRSIRYGTLKRLLKKSTAPSPGDGGQPAEHKKGPLYYALERTKPMGGNNY